MNFPKKGGTLNGSMTSILLVTVLTKISDTVKIHYVGTLEGGPKDGQKFDSSRDRFVIKGYPTIQKHRFINMPPSVVVMHSSLRSGWAE